MRHIFKPRVALLVAAMVLISLLAAWQSSRATPIPPSVGVPAVAFGGFRGLGAPDPLPEPPQIFVQPPMTEKAARVWLKLQKPVKMPFANETPLEDLFKYVQSATADPEHNPNGIAIYVDPDELQEADKTLKSTIVMDLEGLPLALTLKLALKQNDLAYEVHPEGFLNITYIASHNAHEHEPYPRLLNEIEALREEVRELRRALNVPEPKPTDIKIAPGTPGGLF